MTGRSIDERTFESWVREHGPAVYRAAYRVLRSEAAAEDAAQQVFLAALEGRVRAEAEHDVGAQLRWWAVKTALYHLRTQRRRSAREEAAAMTRTERTEPQLAEARESQQVVARLVDELPDDLRLPVVLRFEQEMSFRRIGELCAIAEATAFERVQRGLERLKQQLGRAGFAGLAPALPDLLARVPEQVAVPATLQAQLAALTSAPLLAAGGTSLVAKAALALGGALALTGVLILGGWLSSEPEDAPEEPSIALATRSSETPPEQRVNRAQSGSAQEEATQSRGVASRESAPQQRLLAGGSGRVRGRIVDARGAGIAGAELALNSVESAGKQARFAERTRTDENGFFALELPVVRAPQLYDWTAQSEGCEARCSPEPIALALRAEIELGAIELVPPGGDAAGHAQLRVRVTDERGVAVARAQVHLYRPHSDESDVWERKGWQTQSSDEQGLARFEEKSLGLRHVRAEAAAQGFAPREVAHVLREGENEIEIGLRAGLVLEGRLLAPEGSSVGDNAFLVLQRGDDWSSGSAELGQGGRFAFAGLDEGEYTLAFRSYERWSDFHLDGVRGGGPPLELALKAENDARSSGTHDAEIHGIVVDAADGAELPSLDHDLEMEAVGEGTREEVIARDGLRLLTPFFGQTSQFERGPEEPSARFALDGKAPGRYVLLARRQGFAPSILGPFELAPREVLLERRVEMGRGAAFRGSVRGADGKPLEKAIVFVAPESEAALLEIEARDRAVRESQGQGHLFFGPYCTSGQLGRFALEHVLPELCARLWVLHPAHRPVSVPLRGAAEGTVEEGLEIALRELR